MTPVMNSQMVQGKILFVGVCVDRQRQIDEWIDRR